MHVEVYQTTSRIYYYCTQDAEKDGYVGLHAVLKPSGFGINLFHEMLGTYMTSPPGLGYNLCRGVFGMITDASIP